MPCRADPAIPGDVRAATPAGVPGRSGLAAPAGEPLWVFAYGSLIWDPGFVFERRRHATLYGYRRRLCVYSHRYRGTPEAPGLVLGLDRGGCCRGIAYRVAPDRADEVLDYLWQREMVTGAYRPMRLRVALPSPDPDPDPDLDPDSRPGPVSGGRSRVTACCFVADRSHPQYCCGLGEESVVRLIVEGRGLKGPNWEYLANTVAHLEALGIADRPLRDLLHKVRAQL